MFIKVNIYLINKYKYIQSRIQIPITNQVNVRTR